MKLNEVVPWGRNLEEYKLMFNLSEADLNAKILGCADGPASFNAEMTRPRLFCYVLRSNLSIFHSRD